MKYIAIYTDGACRGNPGPGGWAALLRYEKQEKSISGAEALTTNNRMEMMAAYQALITLKSVCQIDLYTDSQYLKKGITEWVVNWQKKNWKTSNGQAVKNQDLWQGLVTENARHQINWHWVRGHNNHPENEYVDQLAGLAIDKFLTEGSACAK